MGDKGRRGRDKGDATQTKVTHRCRRPRLTGDVMDAIQETITGSENEESLCRSLTVALRHRSRLSARYLGNIPRHDYV